MALIAKWLAQNSSDIRCENSSDDLMETKTELLRRKTLVIIEY
jgi:hypothetical protein